MMELLDSVQLPNKFCVLPVGVIVTSPFDQILKSSSEQTRVEDFFNQVCFLSVINLDWRWRLVILAREKVRSSGIEERDVLDSVDFHGRRKLEFIYVW